MIKPRCITVTIQPNPEHVRIFEVSLRISLLCVNEVGKLGRITYEENRSIVKDPIPVTVIRFQLDSETTRIASSIRGARLSPDRGETHSSGYSLADLMEQLLRRNITQVMSYLEVTVRSSAFRMDLMSN